jgi:Domain of unknown function (DUF6259)
MTPASHKLSLHEELGSIELVASTHILKFSKHSGQLLSLRSRLADDQEFIAADGATPVFSVQYLDQYRRYRQLASSAAVAVEVTRSGRGNDDGVLTARFRQLAGLDIQVLVEVRANPADTFSHWSLTVENAAGLAVTDVQFPFVVCGYQLAGRVGSESLLWPLGPGLLMRAPEPSDLLPDCPHTWQFTPENGDTNHYPGYTFAQFLAYYNDRAGLYLACLDKAGHIKQVKPVHRKPGIRLGIAHVGDWPLSGTRRLNYDIVMGTFTGDWYSAADLYRQWSVQQPWASTPLHKRSDVPSWLLDSPPHVIVRVQGELDSGPAEANHEVLPFSRALQPLERLATRLAGPIVPVLMAWERPGPWIYPDCFPPVGGTQSVQDFAILANQRGWRIGTYCNGTRWVTGHYWSGYDGTDYFEQNDGPASICRLPTGEPWKENWDASWRPSHPCCVGTRQTRDIMTNCVQTLINMGFDYLQFLDQNVGACAFPCFADSHDHVSMPGLWMTENLRELVTSVRELALREKTRQIVFSVEGPPNEIFIQDFQICDIRVAPPGYRPLNTSMRGFVPLYHFLYHEFIPIQGAFGVAPDPYHLQIRTAYSFVLGEIVGAIMYSDGSLMNKDAEMWWASQEPAIGDEEAAIDLLRSATILRRGPARDFLVMGRMLEPTKLYDAEEVCWENNGRVHRVPAVFHTAWQTPGRRFGLALANWTNDDQAVSLSDDRLGRSPVMYVESRNLHGIWTNLKAGLAITMPSHSCALIVAS